MLVIETHIMVNQICQNTPFLMASRLVTPSGAAAVFAMAQLAYTSDTCFDERLGLGGYLLRLFLRRLGNHQNAHQLENEVAAAHNQKHLRHASAHLEREELFLEITRT